MDLLGNEVAQEIEKKNGNAFFVQADVSKDSDVKNLIQETLKEYGWGDGHS